MSSRLIVVVMALVIELMGADVHRGGYNQKMNVFLLNNTQDAGCTLSWDLGMGRQ